MNNITKKEGEPPLGDIEGREKADHFMEMLMPMMPWILPIVGVIVLVLLVTTILSILYVYKMSKKTNQVNTVKKHEQHKVHFFTETKFAVCLKGIIDIRGAFNEAFSVVIALEPHDARNDKDYTKYQHYLSLNVSSNSAWFSMKMDGREIDVESITTVFGNDNLDLGLEAQVVTTYWLSYDRDNMIIKYGKGYAMQETTLMQCDFNMALKTTPSVDPEIKFKLPQMDTRSQLSMFFDIYDKRRETVSILLYRSPYDTATRSRKISLAKGTKAGVIHTERIIKVRKEPLVVNPSPLVMPASSVTMSMIDKNQFLFSSELPLPCKMLYDTIIDCEPLRYKPDLIEAIRHSMTTEGCTLHTVLKTKSYLRIPAGPSFGQSPGVPYVLEFWPKGSKSPIHNHGNVCGIVKVSMIYLHHIFYQSIHPHFKGLLWHHSMWILQQNGQLSIYNQPT